MAGGYQFAPLNVRAVYQNDGSAKSSFLAEVARMTNDAGKMFKDFSNEARTQLDAALSVKRNNTGSLDLGVEELKQAAAAQQARAVAAREVAAATALAAQEEGDYSQKARLAVAATQALAIEEERAAAQARAHAQAAEQVQERLNRQASATDLVVAATKRGTSETGNVINGIRAQRVAFTQLGQQLQDVVVQTQMGTNATTIFVQQVPQMAFALSGLTESTNKFYRGIGAVGSFLSGPWGAAIFAATAVLAPFIANLLSSADAADEANKASRSLGDGIDFASMAAQDLTRSIRELEAAQRKQIQTSYQSEAAALADAEASLKAARAQRERAKAMLQGYLISQQQNAGQGTGGVAGSAGGLLAIQTQKQIADLDKANLTAEKLVRETRIPIERRAAAAATDAAAAVTLKYDKAVGSLNQRYAEGKMTLEAYRSALRSVEAQKEKEEAALRKRKGADPSKEAERAARAANRLRELGEDYGKRIANVRDSFRDIPPEVERVAKASRELDDVISDLSANRPKNFEEMIKQAEALKKELPDLGIQQAMRQITEEAQQQVQYQMLILQGRDGEAQALQIIAQKEKQFGELTRERKEQIIATGIAMQRINEEMQRASEIQGVFLDATRDVRSEVEGILGGYRSLGDLGATLRRSFQQIQGKILTEQIFGDVFRDLDRYVKENTGIGSSVDMLKTETERAGDAAGTLADELLGAAKRISAAGASATASAGFGSSAVLGGWGNIGIPPLLRKPANENYDPNAPIVVTGNKPSSAKRVVDLSPEEFFRRMGQDVGAKWAAQLEPLLGKKFAGSIGGALGGVLEGQATTGTGFGAILGGLKELKGLPKGISGALGKAFGGAQTGAAVAGIGNALGLKMSNTGAQVGAAIGSMLPIPGGEIIGAIAGGFIGKLFSGTKKGYAVATNGNVSTGGNSTQAANAGQGANAINDSLNSIARAFGTSLGNYAVSIGSRSSGYIRVSASGSTKVGDKHYNSGPDVLYDGKDMEEALRIALKNAIEDGAIQGIRAGTKRILSASKNIDAQVEKALKFEKVFKDLRAIKDPVGAALEELNTEFKGLIDIFKEAGASAQEMAELEELYGIRRKEAIKQATEAALGPIKSLLDSLNIGSEFYSLRDRQASAQAIYNPLAERVKAGDMTAYAEFADAAQSLIEINRQIYGSTSQFFDFVDQVKAISQGAVTREQTKIDAATASDSPFTALAAQQQATTSAIDNQTQALLAALGGMNDNLAALIRAQMANASSDTDVSRPAWLGRGYF